MKLWMKGCCESVSRMKEDSGHLYAIGVGAASHS